MQRCVAARTVALPITARVLGARTIVWQVHRGHPWTTGTASTFDHNRHLVQMITRPVDQQLYREPRVGQLNLTGVEPRMCV
jgi:hypothetical protein